MTGLDAAREREFWERGFTVLPGAFKSDELKRMRDAFERLRWAACALRETALFEGSRFVVHEDPAAPAGVAVDRVVWCGACEPVLDEVGRDGRLLAPAAKLLGSRTMQQLINQAHFKMPGDGVAFPWHQDSTHRRFGGGEWRDVNGRGSFVQTMVAVDDVTCDNGPLRFLPGSQSRGHLDLPPDGRLPADIDPGASVAAVMEAGSVLVFGPYVIHGSEPNLSHRPRRVLLNGFAFPGANSRIYPGDGAGRLVEAPPGEGAA
jgi:ectoine hydroxylase-related dioxygenase (phytanoyl-CoA dioxygenase family)